MVHEDRQYNDYTPEEWTPASGLFVACTCGTNHSCCVRNDNVIECVGSVDSSIEITMTPESTQIEISFSFAIYFTNV